MPASSAKDQKVKIDLDRIILELVPRAVDTLCEDPLLFRAKNRYWDYAVQQVHQFLERLPQEQRAGLSEQDFRKERAALFKCPGSPYDLAIGFKPGYQVILSSEIIQRLPTENKGAIMITDENIITAPTFDLSIRPAEKEGTGLILGAALEQFFLRQGDLDVGTLCAFGVKGEDLVMQDLELLAAFLPPLKSGRRTIHTRCNYALCNGQSIYTI